MEINFVWDEEKNVENIKKHGVNFEEARTIFSNFPLEVFFDPEHSEKEDRYIAMGFSDQNRALMVVHCENKSGTTIRLISARKATPNERKQAFGGRR